MTSKIPNPIQPSFPFGDAAVRAGNRVAENVAARETERATELVGVAVGSPPYELFRATQETRPFTAPTATSRLLGQLA